MKLKKCGAVLTGICILTMFAGCYEPLDLTDSELDMVAEYAAGVLVEHGTKSTETLLDRKEQEEAWAELATPTPRPTLAPTKDSKEESKTDTEGNGTAEPTKAPTSTPVPDNTDLTMQDLTGLIGKDDFFFRYTGHEVTTLYQGSGDLFAAAGDGETLVVLKFDVTNQSSTGATLTLNKGASKEFVYTLRVGKRTIKPSLTLLNEDFYTSYEATYQAGETKSCVLVFECEDSLDLSTMTLTVLRDVEGAEDSVLLKVK